MQLKSFRAFGCEIAITFPDAREKNSAVNFRIKPFYKMTDNSD